MAEHDSAPDPAAKDNLTPRQQKWFASVRANLQAKTGKSLEEWIEIARTAPGDKPKARVDWLRSEHGLGINHASYILSSAFSADEPGWDDPDALRARLWKDQESAQLLDAVVAMAEGLPGLVVAQRKSFTAFSKEFQFAAMRPVKGGKALLGLKLDPAASSRLQPSIRKESWSERLTAIVELENTADVDAELKSLFEEAYVRG